MNSLRYFLLSNLVISTISIMVWNPQTTWIPNLGIITTPLGLAIHPRSFGTFRLSIAFNYPSIPTSLQDKCPDKLVNNNLLMRLKNLSKQFDDIMTVMSGNSTMLDNICTRYGKLLCSEFTSSQPVIHKQKRFLPFLAAGLGVAGLGLSIYNTVTEHDVTGEISTLTLNMRQIEQTINNLRDTTDLFIKIEKKAYLHTLHEIGELKQQIADMNCKNHITIGLINGIDLLESAHSKFERVLHAVFRGEITHDILTANNLMKIFSENENWKENIYNSDLSLFYQVARATPLHYSSNERILHILVKFPILEEIDIAPIVKFTNIGTKSKTHLNWKQVVLPNTVSLFPSSNGFEALDIDLNNCQQREWLWICSSLGAASSSHSRCATSILKTISIKQNLSSSCQFKYKTTIDKSVYPVKGGIILTGFSSYKRHSVAVRGLLIGEDVLVDKDSWTYVPISDNESLLVDHLYYKASTTGGNMYVALTDQTIPDFELDQSFNITEWLTTDDYATKYDHILASLPGHIQLTWPVVGMSTWVIILTITIITLICYIYFNGKKQSSKKRIHDVIALKRIDPTSKHPQLI